MKLTVIGTGYVGLVTGTCFAEMGNTVVCIDVDANKIENLKKGIIPIYEPGLTAMVQTNIENKSLFFDTRLQYHLEECEIAFIAVGTPMGEDGSADLKYVLQVAKQIGEHMKSPLIIVNKSTVPVGTGDKVKDVVTKELSKRGAEIAFDVVSNPEFLKEGDAINDFMKPDRVVVGVENESASQKLRLLYAPFFRSSTDRYIEMDLRSAEMTKYVANTMLATKISFMNEVANICELVGADINKVRVGIGSDSRIGYGFIYPGIGYGGSCFPKDVKALKKTAEQHGYTARIISAVEDVNNDQKLVLAKKVLDYFGQDVKGKKIAVWGLAFKPGTNDMREAPALYIIRELLDKGAFIQAYDPKATKEAQEFYFKDVNGITYYESKYDALKDADAMVLLTEWKEFRSPDFDEIYKTLNEPVIFDGRNQYNGKAMESRGFKYFQIGKRNTNSLK